MPDAHVPVTILLDAVTIAATSTSRPYEINDGPKDLTFTFTSVGTTSGGTVLIEESDSPSYTGTWSLLYTQLASGFTGGAKLCVHIRIGAGMWVRARVSADITGGGSVTVTISGI